VLWARLCWFKNKYKLKNLNVCNKDQFILLKNYFLYLYLIENKEYTIYGLDPDLAWKFRLEQDPDPKHCFYSTSQQSSLAILNTNVAKNVAQFRNYTNFSLKDFRLTMYSWHLKSKDPEDIKLLNIQNLHV
jgi:hypothetical protein